jgi:formylglycine-generating enzyme
MRAARIVALPLILALAGISRAADPEPSIVVDMGGGVTMEFVLIKPGAFTQGSPPDEAGRGDDEAPRKVTITRAFYLGRTPVTRGQFARFVAESRCRTGAEKGASGGYGLDGKGLSQRKDYTWKSPGFPQADDHPVTLVSHDDAKAFAEWLGRKARRRFELPTEAQWEYACRAGTSTAFYHGEKAPDAIAWTGENCGDGTRPVGRKAPNDWGLADMAGNVFEWCRDWHGPYGDDPADDPERVTPAGDKPRRALRGGSWLREAKFARSAARYRNDPASRNADNGFRLAASVEPEARAEVVPMAPLDRSEPAIVAFVPQIPAPIVGQAEGNGLGWACPALVVAALVGLFVVLRRSWSKGGRSSFMGPIPEASEVLVRPVVDGFWIDSPGLSQGTEIAYACRIDGTFREDRFRIADGPGGRFVYTGGTPAEIEIREVRAPDPGPDLEWGSSTEPSTAYKPTRSGPGRPASPGRPTPHPPAEPYQQPPPPQQSHDTSRDWSGHPPAY